MGKREGARRTPLSASAAEREKGAGEKQAKSSTANLGRLFMRGGGVAKEKTSADGFVLGWRIFENPARGLTWLFTRRFRTHSSSRIEQMTSGVKAVQILPDHISRIPDPGSHIWNPES